MEIKKILALVALTLTVLVAACFGLLPTDGHMRTIVPMVFVLVSITFFVLHPYKEENKLALRVGLILFALALSIIVALTPAIFGFKMHEELGLVGGVIVALVAAAGPVFALLQTDQKVLDEIDKLRDDFNQSEKDLKEAQDDLKKVEGEKTTAETNLQAANERAEAAEAATTQEREAKEAAQTDLKDARDAHSEREQNLQGQIDDLNADLGQAQKDLEESEKEAAFYLSENGKLEKRIEILTQAKPHFDSKEDSSENGNAADGSATSVEITIETKPTETVTEEEVQAETVEVTGDTVSGENGAATPVITETPTETAETAATTETPIDAVVVPAADTPTEEEEDVVDGAVVLMKDPSGRTVIKESAIPQTSVYLHKVEEDEEVVSFEVCSTDEIDGDLCVGVLSTRNGKRDKEMYFRIPAGKKKSKRLIRVPRGANIGLDIIEYLHLNPGGQVLDTFNITELLPYRIQGCQSSIQAAEVYVVDVA